MFTAVAEGTGKCLVLCHCFLHQIANFFVAWHTERSRRCQGIINLQRMVDRMASQTVTGRLTRSMGLMAHGTIGDLAVYFMAERTGQLCMGTFIIDKILARAFMAGKTGFLYVIGKMQGKRFVGI
jgi:hypothetical protein